MSARGGPAPGPEPNQGGSASEPRSETQTLKMPTLRTRAPEPGSGFRVLQPGSSLPPTAPPGVPGTRARPRPKAHPLPGPNCRPGLRVLFWCSLAPRGPGGRDWAVGWMCCGERQADLDLVAATPSTHPLWRPALETPTPPAPRSWAEASRETLMAGRGKSRDFTHSDSLP